jgi:hypothetical protein
VDRSGPQFLCGLAPLREEKKEKRIARKAEKAQSLRMTSLLLGIDFLNFSSFTYDHF